MPGETLGHISAWYTGSLHHWREIAAANAGLDVNRIKIGQHIKIPASLLKRNTPMKRVVAARAAEEVRKMPVSAETDPFKKDTVADRSSYPARTARLPQVNWGEVGDYLYPDQRRELGRK
jgi:hypothetical protein